MANPVMAARKREERKRILRQRAKMDRKVEKFLQERRESDGGYAPVTIQDHTGLCEILELLVEMKWGPDPDGDFPVEVKITNRHAQERLQFQPLPYWHKAETELQKRQILQDAMYNLAMATTQL